MPSWNPSDYAVNSPKQQCWGEELLAKIELRGNERILDIGCGDGRLTAKIARRVPRGSVLGMDSSGEMIAHAEKEHPADEVPNLSFAEGDAREVGFYDQFDLIFSNAALHWVIDHRPMIKNMERALQAGGRIVWQMGGKGNAGEMAAVVEEIMALQKWRDYYGNFTFPYGFHGAEEYCGWLEEEGLMPQRVELIEKDMAHQGKEGLAAWLRTTWLPYLDPLPPEFQQEFINLVCNAYLVDHSMDRQEMVSVKMIRLEVEARKHD